MHQQLVKEFLKELFWENKVNKRQKGIMVWIIIWAGLLVAVLYSPIGSPDLYSTQNYYVENRTITTGNIVIQNAPKVNSSSENSDNGLDIPDISSLPGTNYTVRNYQSANSGSQGTSYGVQIKSSQSVNSSGSTGQVLEGSSFISSGKSSSRNSAGSSAIVMTNGITTLSLTNDISSNSTKQSATPYRGGSGGTDPGGDPTGPAIPVGDGWGLLVLFGLCYIAFKKRLFIIEQFNKHVYKQN